MTLRTRLISTMMVLCFGVVVVVAGIFVHIYNKETQSLIDSKSTAVRDDLRKKGMALARNVALASERALVVRDYLFLTQILKTTRANDPEIKYGILMNAERQAIAHSEPALAGRQLDGPADRFAAEQTQMTSQLLDIGGEQILEVICPIEVAGAPWGWIRFGVSLAALNKEIADNEAHAHKQSMTGIIITLAAAIVMILLGSVFGAVAAGRIVGPVDKLMAGAHLIRDGVLDQRVEVEGSPEFVALAGAFNDMSKAVRDRDETLRHNMADLQQALTTAKEANRLKSEFLANISHELRTPLNAIINIPIALLQQFESRLTFSCTECDHEEAAEVNVVGGEETIPCSKCGGKTEFRKGVVSLAEPAEQQHFLSRLQGAGRHLLNVVNDLLDFSKLEAGKLTLHMDTVQVGAMLFEIGQTLETLAKDKRITIRYPRLDKPTSLRGDVVKLQQIFINLLGNALKFTPVGGEISVTVNEEIVDGKEAVVFSVRDTGPGIAPAHQETIFEAFRQVDGSHTRTHGGTGLGLAITRQLVELHGGAIRVESRLGEGSNFVFHIPKTGPERKAIDEGAKHSQSDFAGEMVLVIDDNEVQLEIAKMVLEHEGYGAELCRDPSNALQRVRDMQPCFVILDVMMPSVSGLQILRELKSDELTKHIPVVVSTAYHSNRELVVSLGGIWLPKPWHGKDLIRKIKSLPSRCPAKEPARITAQT